MTVPRQKKGHAGNSRHQEKDRYYPRSRFMQAAEKIFARDGFDSAKLEEIAAEAGYTRGAFYANFDSKEDLFLALLETGDQFSHRRSAPAGSQTGESFRQAERAARFLAGHLPRPPLEPAGHGIQALRRTPSGGESPADTMHQRLVFSGVELLQNIMDALGRRLPVSARAVGIAFWA